MYPRWSHYAIIWCGDLDGKTLVSAELPLSQISTWPLSCDNVVSRQLMLNKNHDQIHVFLCCLPGESSIKSNITEANVVWLHSFNINAQAAEINAQVLYWISEVGDEINPPLYMFLGLAWWLMRFCVKQQNKQQEEPLLFWLIAKTVPNRGL